MPGRDRGGVARVIRVSRVPKQNTSVRGPVPAAEWANCSSARVVGHRPRDIQDEDHPAGANSWLPPGKARGRNGLRSARETANVELVAPASRSAAPPAAQRRVVEPPHQVVQHGKFVGRAVAKVFVT